MSSIFATQRPLNSSVSPPAAANKAICRQQKQRSRREWVLSSVSLFALIGSDDPVTVVNSVLSGYGLPTLSSKPGFKAYDRFEDDFTFQYPKSWVVVRNRIRKGVYISDFKTADKITTEEFPASQDALSSHEGFIKEVVSKFVSPGEGQQNDQLELPPINKIQSTKATQDGQEYVYIEFPSSTITRSGYQVKRLNTAVAAEQDSTIYALCASTRSEEASVEKEQIFNTVVESFRLR